MLHVAWSVCLLGTWLNQSRWDVVWRQTQVGLGNHVWVDGGQRLDESIRRHEEWWGWCGFSSEFFVHLFLFDVVVRLYCGEFGWCWCLVCEFLSTLDSLTYSLTHSQCHRLWPSVTLLVAGQALWYCCLRKHQDVTLLARHAVSAAHSPGCWPARPPAALQTTPTDDRRQRALGGPVMMAYTHWSVSGQ